MKDEVTTELDVRASVQTNDKKVYNLKVSTHLFTCIITNDKVGDGCFKTHKFLLRGTQHMREI